MTLEWSALPWIVLGAGAGLAPAGPQFAGMARVRWWLGDGYALGAGYGLSMGPHRWEGRDALGRDDCPTCAARERTWRTAVWGNGELGLEHVAAWGLALRMFLGGGRLLNANDGACSPAGACTASSGTVIVYGGLAVGYEFRL
jgi:hypothetical protein